MFTDFIKQFDHIAERVKATTLSTEPWDHLYVRNIFEEDFYEEMIKFPQWQETQLCLDANAQELGRQTTIFNTENNVYRNNLEEFNDKTNMLFHLLTDKFSETEYRDDYVTCTSNFWEDTNALVIQDIHTDAFFDTRFSLSGQFYLPPLNDQSQIDYGTSLYKYIGDDICKHSQQNEGLLHPSLVFEEHECYYENSLTVPFESNSALFTINKANTWHRAPRNIKPSDIRKSMMFRWKV